MWYCFNQNLRACVCVLLFLFLSHHQAIAFPANIFPTGFWWWKKKIATEWNKNKKCWSRSVATCQSTQWQKAEECWTTTFRGNMCVWVELKLSPPPPQKNMLISSTTESCNRCASDSVHLFFLCTIWFSFVEHFVAKLNNIKHRPFDSPLHCTKGTFFFLLVVQHFPLTPQDKTCWDAGVCYFPNITFSYECCNFFAIHPDYVFKCGQCVWWQCVFFKLIHFLVSASLVFVISLMLQQNISSIHMTFLCQTRFFFLIFAHA